jgi:integrase
MSAERKAAGVPIARFGPIWKALEPHFGHRLGRAITRRECQQYHRARKAQGRADSTIKTELDLLRACLKSHYGEKAPPMWSPSPSAPRDRWLSIAEVEKLLAAIETHHVRLFVILALCTGARMTAILDLTWDRVDFAIRTIDLRPAGRETTNKRRTVVPMNNRALAALTAAEKGAMTDYVIEWRGERVASVKKAIREASRRAGVPCSPHVFRHTAAVWAVQAGASIEEIAQFLGHTSTRVTASVYARFSPTYLRRVADALEF